MLELLAFDELSNFDTSAFKCSIKWAYSSKAKSSNVHDFLVAKNTVHILNLVCVHIDLLNLVL